jgi:rhodanese-related sulfurtransferase
VDRITAGAYRDVRSEPHVLIDVRPAMEFEICHLPDALNVPLKDLASEQFLQKLREVVTKQGSNDNEFPGEYIFYSVHVSTQKTGSQG